MHERRDTTMGGELKHRKQIGITMSKKTYERFKAYSEKMMIPMSRIVEKLVTEYLDKVEEK
jgi:predicted DNA-binding protein